jgi:hypothetical protein
VKLEKPRYVSRTPSMIEKENNVRCQYQEQLRINEVYRRNIVQQTIQQVQDSMAQWTMLLDAAVQETARACRLVRGMKLLMEQCSMIQQHYPLELNNAATNINTALTTLANDINVASSRDAVPSDSIMDLRDKIAFLSLIFTDVAPGRLRELLTAESLILGAWGKGFFPVFYFDCCSKRLDFNLFVCLFVCLLLKFIFHHLL